MKLLNKDIKAALIQKANDFGTRQQVRDMSIQHPYYRIPCEVYRRGTFVIRCLPVRENVLACAEKFSKQRTFESLRRRR